MFVFCSDGKMRDLTRGHTLDVVANPSDGECWQIRAEAAGSQFRIGHFPNRRDATRAMTHLAIRISADG